MIDEADSQLARYLPIPENESMQPGTEVPPRPILPDGTVDAPLVRVYNFLRAFFFSKVPINFKLLLNRDDVSFLPTGNSVVSGYRYTRIYLFLS